VRSVGHSWVDLDYGIIGIAIKPAAGAAGGWARDCHVCFHFPYTRVRLLLSLNWRMAYGPLISNLMAVFCSTGLLQNKKKLKF
jgi:hypothetical protein